MRQVEQCGAGGCSSGLCSIIRFAIHSWSLVDGVLGPCRRPCVAAFDHKGITVRMRRPSHIIMDDTELIMRGEPKWQP